MDRLKELNEAKVAAAEVIARIDNAISSLGSASSWGILDIFGGGLISSAIKREKISSANDDIREITSSLKALNKELEDVNMHLPEEISNSVSDEVFDIWFDNIFTDIRVQGEITDSLNNLRDFRKSVGEIINKLNEEIKNCK